MHSNGRAPKERHRPSRLSVVLLVRHGKTPTTGRILPGRSPGLHLAEEGKAQAEAAASRIAALPRPPVAVYASPLERTRETAAPIAKALGLRVQTDRGLLEADVGEWTGEELKKLMKGPEWPVVQRWPSAFRFPGGESFTELFTRAHDTVLRLSAAHPGETVVAVSHADTIRAAVAMTAGLPLDLFQRLVIAPCSISALAFGPGGPYVLCTGSTGSLAELAPS